MSYETILQELADRALLRRLRSIDAVEGTRLELENTSLTNFAGNDYLGLSQHPAVRQAAIEAIDRFGLGAAASRLITGTLAPHKVLEEQLAAFKGTEQSIALISFCISRDAFPNGAIQSVCIARYARYGLS